MKYVPFIVFLYLFVFLVRDSKAQTYNYRINIKDSLTGEPVEDVSVIDSKAKILGESGYLGIVEFTSDLDSLLIELIHPNFYNKKVVITKTTDALNIRLYPLEKSIDSAVVRAQKQIKNLSNSELQNQVIERTSKQESFIAGAFNLEEVVQSMATTQISNDPYTGASAGINGMSTENTKILIDGQPVTGKIAGGVDLSQISMNNIQAVQVYFGPQSIIYGSDASGGVINLISFTGEDRFSGIVKTSLQSIQKAVVEANINLPIQKSKFNLNYTGSFFGGKKDTIPRRYLWLPKYQNSLGLNWSNKYRMKNNGDLFIKARSDFYKEELIDPGTPFVSETQGIAYAFDNRYFTNRNNSSLTFNLLGPKWKHEFQNSLSLFSRIKKSYRKDFVQETTNEIPDSLGNVTDDFRLLQSRYIMSRDLEKFSIQLGGDFNSETAKGLKVLDAVQNDFALFSMFKYSWKNWNLIPGLRFNSYQSYGNQMLPAFQIKKIFSDKFYIEAGYIKSFRAPSLKERFLDFKDVNHDIIGNPNLKAETSDSYTLGMEYKMDANKTTAKVKLSTSLNNSFDKILLSQLDTAASYTYINLGDLQNASQVLSIDIVPKWTKSKLKLSSVSNFIEYLNFQDSTKTSISQTFDIKWKTHSQWGIHFNSKTNINQTVFVQDINKLYLRQLKPFTMINLGIQKIWKSLSFETGIRNLLDVQQVQFKDGKSSIGTIGSIHGTSGSEMLTSFGRNVYLTLSYSWD